MIRTSGLALAAVFTAAAHEPITTNLTWTQEISRIIYKHCADCHRAGGRSFSLMSYEEARPWAKAIRDEVLERRMPPWDAVKGVGEFLDDPSLSQPEIDMLVSWVEGGAPDGNAVYLPHPPHFDPTPQPPPRTPELAVRGSLTLERPLTIVGIRPAAATEVTALLPDGSVRHLLWVRDYREQWNRTYWLRTPLALPRGTRISGNAVIAISLPAR